MRKWAIIVVGVLVLVAALGAVTAQEDQELSDEETEELIDAIEDACAEADCNPGGGPLTDEQIEDLGFDSLLIADAWGICDIEGEGGPEQTCVCTEPPIKTGDPDQMAIYVGRQAGMIVVYDTLACTGQYEDSTWTWTVAGGCRKGAADLENLEVFGNYESGIDEDNIVLVREGASVGDCDFTDWWSSAYFWDSVLADGLGGKDDVRGSPQADDLTGEIVRGYEGNDEIWLTINNVTTPIAWGGENNDTIHGSALGDSIQGDNGNDTIYGNGGTDTLYGENGNDVLYGGTGDGDKLYDGYNYDTLSDSGGSGDHCDCGPSTDPPAGPGCDTYINCDP